MKRLTICLILVLYGLIAPSLSFTKDLPIDPTIPWQASKSTDFFERFYAWPDSLTTEAMEYQRDWLMHLHFDALHKIGDLLESEEVVDREDLAFLRQYLKRHQQEEYYFLLAQSIAFFICDPILLSPNEKGRSTLVEVTQKTFTDVELEALGFSTSLLVAHYNPTADLVATALQALSGYWPDDDIQRSARQAKDAATAWLNSLDNSSNNTIHLFKQRHQSISKALNTLNDLAR